MFGLGFGEIVIILFIALVFIGPKKLPELARGLGKGLREFNKAKNELLNEVNKDPENTAELKQVDESKSDQIDHESSENVQTTVEKSDEVQNQDNRKNDPQEKAASQESQKNKTV